MNTRILVIDDKENIRTLVSEHLDTLGYEVKTAEDGPSGLELFNDNIFEIVITDIKMPGGMDGLQILDQVKETSPETAVIMITAFADMDDAIDALKRGASDYLKKPFKLEDIESAVEKAVSAQRLMLQNRLLRREVEKKYNFSNIIARSEPMNKVFDAIERLAPSNSTVLITGETGTGKELVAWAIHDNSNRRDAPFMVVNCAAIPSTLLESELFGHVKGAFTDAKNTKKGRFEEADGGTVFLDEVGELPPEIQVKLLRVLENGEMSRIGENRTRTVDVRVIAATNVELEAAVRESRFRKDLFFRLNVLPVHMPPLRERREDIPLLLRHFLDMTCKDNKIPLKHFTPEAVNYLVHYDWPGNVRELHNLVERCVLMARGNEVPASELPEYVTGIEPAGDDPVAIDIGDDFSMKDAVDGMVGRVEKQLIEKALEKSGGNKDRAAALLRISRRSLFYKLKEYGIS